MSIQNWVMFIISATLVYLAIKKGYEPLLLIPIAFGIVLANFPLADMGSYGKGIIGLIYRTGVETELLPPIIFLGIGVLTDFRPLLSRPFTFLLGALHNWEYSLQQWVLFICLGLLRRKLQALE